jgi:hypothetical protein
MCFGTLVVLPRKDKLSIWIAWLTSWIEELPIGMLRYLLSGTGPVSGGGATRIRLGDLCRALSDFIARSRCQRPGTTTHRGYLTGIRRGLSSSQQELDACLPPEFFWVLDRRRMLNDGILDVRRATAKSHESRPPSASLPPNNSGTPALRI